MEIRPIRTEADYDAALVDIEQYFDHEPAPGTPEADRFDMLAALIGAYEDEHHAIEAPDAVSAIAEVMLLRGYKQADMGRLLGSAPRASEIMNRKRHPTIEQARKLHEEWGVPAASLLATEKPLPTKVVAFRRVERRPQVASRVERRHQEGAGVLALAQLQDQIEAIRREAYDAGYAAAMQAILEFSRPAAERAAPRRGRGDNARHITEALMTLPNHTGPAAAIKRALAEQGHDLAYRSIRQGLGQLVGRNEVTASEDGKIWRYVGEPA